MKAGLWRSYQERPDVRPHCRDGQGRACSKIADGIMVAPDGEFVPGGFSCTEHAALTIAEYAAKLGEHWTLRTFDAMISEFQPPNPLDGTSK